MIGGQGPITPSRRAANMPNVTSHKVPSPRVRRNTRHRRRSAKFRSWTDESREGAFLHGRADGRQPPRAADRLRLLKVGRSQLSIEAQGPRWKRGNSRSSGTVIRSVVSKKLGAPNFHKKAPALFRQQPSVPPFKEGFRLRRRDGEFGTPRPKQVGAPARSQENAHRPRAGVAARAAGAEHTADDPQSVMDEDSCGICRNFLNRRPFPRGRYHQEI